MENILNVYTEFAKSIDNNIKVLFDNNWQCDTKTKTIYIPLIESEEECERFVNNFKKEWCKDRNIIKLRMFSPVTMSFLHEIGHTQTKQGDIISKILRKISNFLCKHKATKKLSYKIYYNIPEEKRATQWAIGFIAWNYFKTIEFNTDIENAYFEFYDKIIEEN